MVGKREHRSVTISDEGVHRCSDCGAASKSRSVLDIVPCSKSHEDEDARRMPMSPIPPGLGAQDCLGSVEPPFPKRGNLWHDGSDLWIWAERTGMDCWWKVRDGRPRTGQLSFGSPGLNDDVETLTMKSVSMLRERMRATRSIRVTPIRYAGPSLLGKDIPGNFSVDVRRIPDKFPMDDWDWT